MSKRAIAWCNAAILSYAIPEETVDVTSQGDVLQA